MSRYQIETTAPDGKPIIVPIPDGFLDRIRTDHARELIHQVRRAIADGAGNDWDWWDAATIPESVLTLIDPDVE